jgi:3-hydroxyisobutyrate dehydrogenase
LVSAGVAVVDSAVEAVRGANIIMTVLKDRPAVLDVMKSTVPSLRDGMIWIQASTVGPSGSDQLAEFAKQHGLIFYDAPIQGTRVPAEQGTLVILVSGPVTSRDQVQEVSNAIGHRTVWVSEHPGDSSRLKLSLNSLVFALTHGTAESLALAKALGLDPELVVDVVRGGPLDSGYFQTKAAAILAGDYVTSFSVTNAVKDSQLLVEAAEQADTQVDIAVAGLERYRRVLKAGHGDKDIAASYLAS